MIFNPVNIRLLAGWESFFISGVFERYSFLISRGKLMLKAPKIKKEFEDFSFSGLEFITGRNFKNP